MRIRQLSLSTERNYLHHIVDYLHLCKAHNNGVFIHPAELGTDHIRAYLLYLVEARHVAASTQNSALSALLFLYRHALGIDLPYVGDVEWSKRDKRIPTVFDAAETNAILARLMPTPHHLLAAML